MKLRKEYYPNSLEIKILITVEHLNSLKLYPTSEGIYKILKGIVDSETKALINCPTFSILLSGQKKKITLKSSLLVRHDFLMNKYYQEKDMMVLEITHKGKIFLGEYKKKHKTDFAKKLPKTPISIVKID